MAGISKEEMAANYGWALSFLKSNHELWKLFNKAVDGSWSVNRFVASLRNTGWFKKHSDTYRQMQVLKKTDSATYSQRVQQKYAQIQDMAASLGADISKSHLGQLANNAMWFNWDESMLRNVLSNYVDQMGNSGHYGGEAGKAEDELRQYAADMGITVSDGTLKGWLKNVVAQNQTTDDYKAWIQGQAQSAFSSIADQIKAGQTVKQIADPYIQQMGQTLELDANAIDLKDPTIRKALQTTGPDGKPMMKTLWQFDEDLKKDSRWLSTNNAKSSLLNAGNQLLKDFGFHW